MVYVSTVACQWVSHGQGGMPEDKERTAHAVNWHCIVSSIDQGRAVKREVAVRPSA